MYIVLSSLGQTTNNWASWPLQMHSHLTACEVFPSPFQMLLPINKNMGTFQATYTFHLPILWKCVLTWHLYYNRWDTLWFGWTIQPTDSLYPHSDYHRGPIFFPPELGESLQTYFWSWSKDEKQAWVWMKAWINAQNEEQVFLWGDPTLHWGELPEVFHFFCKVWDNLIQQEQWIQNFHLNIETACTSSSCLNSFSLTIATTTICSASEDVTNNINLSAEGDLTYEIQSKMLISTQ